MLSKYYKVIGENYENYNFPYKLGLNVDINPFNPKGSCKKGGLYFTTDEYINDYLWFGSYVAEIEIPDDASVYKEDSRIYGGDIKYKADKIIITKFIDMCDYLTSLSIKKKDTVMRILKTDGHMLRFIRYPSLEMMDTAVRSDGHIIDYIIQTQRRHLATDIFDELCRLALKQSGCCVKYIVSLDIQESQKQELYNIGVRSDGNAIQYIPNKSEALCLLAVKQNGLALYYIRNQTEQICLAAVRQNGMALRYCIIQTKEIINEAIRQNKEASNILR